MIVPLTSVVTAGEKLVEKGTLFVKVCEVWNSAYDYKVN